VRAELLPVKAVAPGSRLAVVSPASTPRADRVERGLRELAALGYEPVLFDALRRGPLYFAGSPEQRLASLHSAFADDSVGAILATRGGYGSAYLLDGLDWELIASHAKPFFAYSDLTAVQTVLLDRIRLPVFHGPMLAPDFAREGGVDISSFRAALEGRALSLDGRHGLRALRPGSARGVLYGGVLSLLVSLLGTPCAPRTEGRLLFLEDVGVKPYQVDRMLRQLAQAGKLEGVRGVIFGEMLDCSSGGAPPDLLEQAILYALREFEGPIAFGLRSGHVSGANVSLPLGLEAELLAGPETRLTLLESAVEP
jgi:muramoyltetrapeptide carboxypeptidase